MPALQLSLADASRKVRYDRPKLLRLIRAVLRRRMPKAVVDIAIVNSRRIAAINRKYLRRRGATDVIAFNLGRDADGRAWGQIVVCAEVARREAHERGIRAEDELALYVAHGALHLLGETDDSAGGREQMRRLAARALVKAGYADVT